MPLARSRYRSGGRFSATLIESGTRPIAVAVHRFSVAESHRPVGTNPVRRVIGLAGFPTLSLHDNTITAEQNVPLGNALGRQQQVLIVATEDHQQLDVRGFRMVDHFDSRRFHRRMVAQEVRTLIVGREDDRVTFRYLIEVDRELLTRQPALLPNQEATIAAACCCMTSGAAAKNHRAASADGCRASRRTAPGSGRVVTDLQRLMVKSSGSRPISSHNVTASGFHQTSR